MLQDIWEGKKAAFVRSHLANCLDAGAPGDDVEHIANSLVVVLCVLATSDVFGGHLLTECEVRLGDVVVVVVVECRCADAVVQLTFDVPTATLVSRLGWCQVDIRKLDNHL